MGKIEVRKGKTVISNKKGVKLIARSLGSALAIVASDPVAVVSGMAVCILPKKVYRDSSIPDVIEQMRDLFKHMVAKGARPENLLIFLSGAAGFLQEPEELSLGKRLYKIVKKTLRKNGLKLQGEHVGGPLNRSVTVEVGTPGLIVTMLDEKECRL